MPLSAGGAGPASRARCFSLHPHKACSRFRSKRCLRSSRGSRPAARCWRQHGNRAQRLGRRLGPADRTPSSWGGWSVSWLHICARLPGAGDQVISLRARRACAGLGARFTSPGDAPEDCDLFHAAAPAGLANALRLAGEEGHRRVELARQRRVAAPLGERCSRRLLVSSQVGSHCRTARVD